MTAATRELLGRYVAERTSVLAVAELDERAEIRSANEPLKRLAGAPLIGRHVDELVAPAQRGALAGLFADVGAGSETAWRQRLLGLFPDERGIPLDFVVTLHRSDDGWLFIAEPAETASRLVNERLVELTEELAVAQRRINQQNVELRHRNERLLELDRVKDALLANVSHDLRTPLTAILGYAELLRRRGGLGEKQVQATAVIERNARRLLRLVNDLLLLAQVRAGRLRLDLEPVDLAELAEAALELARPLAEQADLAIRLDASPVLPALVEGDRLRLNQLLENLLANAIKFTPAGGHVTVRVHTDDALAVLVVEDDGPGIPEHERARLYEAFTRGGGAGAPGAGLGLAIVREVAEAHEATVELESQPEAGSRFEVAFRRIERPANREPVLHDRGEASR